MHSKPLGLSGDESMLGVLERRVDVSVVRVHHQPAVMILGSELETLTQRIARVGEVATAVDGGGDGDDVVVVLGAEHAGRPLENVLVVEARELAAQA